MGNRHCWTPASQGRYRGRSLYWAPSVSYVFPLVLRVDSRASGLLSTHSIGPLAPRLQVFKENIIIKLFWESLATFEYGQYFRYFYRTTVTLGCENIVVETFLTFSDSQVKKPVHSIYRQLNFYLTYGMLAKAALLHGSITSHVSCFKFSRNNTLRTKKKEMIDFNNNFI